MRTLWLHSSRPDPPDLRSEASTSRDLFTAGDLETSPRMIPIKTRSLLTLAHGTLGLFNAMLLQSKVESGRMSLFRYISFIGIIFDEVAPPGASTS